MWAKACLICWIQRDMGEHALHQEWCDWDDHSESYHRESQRVTLRSPTNLGHIEVQFLAFFLPHMRVYILYIYIYMYICLFRYIYMVNTRIYIYIMYMWLPDMKRQYVRFIATSSNPVCFISWHLGGHQQEQDATCDPYSEDDSRARCLVKCRHGSSVMLVIGDPLAGSGVRWSPYSVDPKTGQQFLDCIWIP